MAEATGQKTPLPDYDNPPVVETILGVQFEPLAGFTNAHLGAFWKALDAEEWPAVDDAPPLPPEFERFGEGKRWAKGVHLQLTQDFTSRLRIKNKAGHRMIQIQNGRLHFNWLGQTGGPYPRYAEVRDGFKGAFDRFRQFAVSERLGEVKPNQWEVTYLNHIPKGTVWKTPSDWVFCQALAPVPVVEGLVRDESFGGSWKFVIADQRGRLHVQWQHGKRSEPGEQEIIVLTLTARGPLTKSDDAVQAVFDGLDLGREAIVRSFARLMSDEANKYWGFRHANG